MTPLLRTLFVFITFFFISLNALAFNLPHDGHVRLFITHQNREVELQYLDQSGRWIPSVHDQINTLLKSRGDGAVGHIDPRLIELADHLQDHFGADTIEVISGYRSPTFNAQLKSEGHGVASGSYHTRGLAMDVHIDEIKETTLRDYLKTLALGGVGYYGRDLMVHMDFGPPRQWAAGLYSDTVTVGEFNRANPVTLKTDKFTYDLSTPLQITATGASVINQTLTVQKFFRGQWVSVGTVVCHGGPLVFSQLARQLSVNSPYGKFRFHMAQGRVWQNSNEFYIKKM